MNGHPVQVVYLNNQGRRLAPSRIPSAWSTKKRSSRSSISAPRPPTLPWSPTRSGADAARFLGSAVCPPDVYPPKPDPLLFCSSFNLLGEDGKAIVHFLKELRGTSAKLGLLAMDIPISRQGVDQMEKLARQAASKSQETSRFRPPRSRFHAVCHPLQGRRSDLDRALGAVQLRGGVVRQPDTAGLDGNYSPPPRPRPKPTPSSLPRRTSRHALVHFLGRGTACVQGDRRGGEKVRRNLFGGFAVGWIGGWYSRTRSNAAACRAAPRNPTSLEESGSIPGNLRRTGGLEPENHVRSAAYYKLYRWDAAQKRVVKMKDWLRIPIQ